jgi:arginine:pyruvate transaminase
MTENTLGPPGAESAVFAMPLAACTSAIAEAGMDAWELSDRAARRAEAGEDIILLTVGDPDSPTPECVVDAATRSLRAGRTHYAPIPGTPALRAAVARSAAFRLNSQFEARNVIIFPGAQCALFSAMHCVAGPGDEVILLEPSYATYALVVAACGAQAVRVCLRPEEEFGLDVDRIACALSPRCRAIVINSPNNPCGSVYRRDALADLVTLCARHRVWILSDEVYAGLAFEGQHVSPASLPDGAACSIVIESLSKSHAMTGWRIGWAIAPPSLARHLERLAEAQLFSSPTFIQDAAVVALEQAPKITQGLRRDFLRRRDLFLEGLEGCAQLSVFMPQGGMFVLVDVSKSGLSARDFARNLLDKEGVAVVPGNVFGSSMAGSVRVALNQSEERLIEACHRIRRFVERLDPSDEQIIAAVTGQARAQ